MNSLGIALVWCALQVTLACSVGAAVFLLARKAGWVAGRVTTIASLTLVLALSAAALSPWPSWISLESTVSAPSSSDDALQESGPSIVSVDSVTTQQSTQLEPSGPLNMAFWRSVWADMQTIQSTADMERASTSNAWRWPALVACAFLVTAAIGLLRLLLAWFAVRRLDRQSTTINDTRLTQLAATISRDLSLSHPIVLKESPELQSAATFGWRQPVILLPCAWQDWPAEELCAVLAHELAHVARGDFLIWIFAQITVALHFYHPLVHWLAGRLRLEQELAADATATRFAGGRETYLQSLATLTLRADHLRPSWATQTFLPTRSMFVRRIEMLKRTKPMEQEKLSGKARLAVIGALVAIGLLAGGLRSPGTIEAMRLVAAEPSSENASPTQKTKSEGYDFAYVPEDFFAVLAIRPAEMASSANLSQLAKLLGENMSPSIPVEAVEQITLVMPVSLRTEKGLIEPGEYSIFRTNRGIDFKKNLEARYGAIKDERHKALDYWTWGGGLEGMTAFHSPDEKTLLIRLRSLLFEIMDDPRAAEPPAQAAAWQDVATGPFFGVVNVKTFREFQGNQPAGKLPGGFVIQMFAPILDDVEHVTFTVDGQDELVLKAQLVCTEPEQVPAVEQTLRSALVLLENIVTSQLQALQGQSDEDSREIKELLSLASIIIENANITSEGRYLRLVVPLNSVQPILQVAERAFQASQEAARRTQSQNNIRQIALAFHRYHAEHGHFPPAVLYDKESGTPYSWRVAILPYLMQQDVYDQYHFNEPWDSENNKKVLELRPAQLLSPTEPTSTNTAYFALVGPETIFAGKEGISIKEITDGAKNTILVVEAKRDIPWTKPEDIPYASDKPLPKLGGFFQAVYNTAFCDGRPHFISEGIDQQTLRYLIEKADGQIVNSLGF